MVLLARNRLPTVRRLHPPKVPLAVVGSADGEGNAVVASDSYSGTGAVSLLSRLSMLAHSAVEASEAVAVPSVLCSVRAELTLVGAPSKPPAPCRLQPCGKVAPVSRDAAALAALDEVANGGRLWSQKGCSSSPLTRLISEVSMGIASVPVIVIAAARAHPFRGAQ